MPRNSTASSFAERLRRRTEEERKLLERYERRRERLLESDLEKLAASSRSAAERARRRIDAAFDGVLRHQGWTTALAWAAPLAAGIALFGLIMAWNWAAWELGVERRGRERARLEAEIRERELTLERLEEKTWGIELRREPDGMYVVLSEGTAAETGLRVDGREAIRLSRD